MADKLMYNINDNKQNYPNDNKQNYSFIQYEKYFNFGNPAS